MWNSLITWVTGATPTAAFFNAAGLDLRTWGGNVNASNNRLDQLAGLTAPGQPRAFSRNTATVSIPTGAWTTVPLDTDDYNVGPLRNTGGLTYAFTAITTGLYQVTGLIGFASNATGIRYGRIFVSGAGLGTGAVSAVSMGAVNGDATYLSLPVVLLQLTAGQSVYMQAMHNAGVAIQTIAGFTYLAGVQLF